MSDVSGVFESNKHILSEGRADLIGRRFNFDNGNIVRVTDELNFHSHTGNQKPLFLKLLEAKGDSVTEIQKRKYSNHLEYNLGNSSPEPFSKNIADTKPVAKTIMPQVELAESNCQQNYAVDTLHNKPTEDDIGNVKVRVSN